MTLECTGRYSPALIGRGVKALTLDILVSGGGGIRPRVFFYAER